MVWHPLDEYFPDGWHVGDCALVEYDNGYQCAVRIRGDVGDGNGRRLVYLCALDGEDGLPDRQIRRVIRRIGLLEVIARAVR
jgi:hypothetical protein